MALPPKALIVLLCLELSLAPAYAQTPQPTQPVIRVTTRLIQINVIAQDRKGHPVTDLTKDDFTLKDNGQDQKISLFSLESMNTPNTPVSAAASQAGEPAARVYSNRIEQKASGTTIILFDGLNTKFEDQAYAKQQLIKYLQELRSDDRIALYTLGTSLRILHDFTTSTDSLLRILAKYRGRINTEVDTAVPDPADTGDDQMDEFINSSNQKLADYVNVNRARQTMEALEAIAAHVGRLPGRKNLVWISGGFPFAIGIDESTGPGDTREKRIFSEESERATRALNNANIAVYPVDARGLKTDARMVASNPARTNIRRPPPSPSVDRNYDTFQVAAERTGGRVFHNVNDLSHSIRSAIDESRVTYLIGFYPAHDNWDGKFHELKLKVSRPGVHIRYRLGYFAFPEQPAGADHQMISLGDAISRPLELTGVGLTVSLKPAAGGYDSSVVVDPHNITLAEKDGKWVGALDLLIIRGATGTPAFSGKPIRVNLRFTPETKDRVMEQGLTLKQPVAMPAGTNEIRIAVQDIPTGTVGTVFIKVG
jgi:VWFA-related protein